MADQNKGGQGGNNPQGNKDNNKKKQEKQQRDRVGEDSVIENTIALAARYVGSAGIPAIAERLPQSLRAGLRDLVKGGDYGPMVRRLFQGISLFASDDEPRDLIAGIGEGLGRVLTGLAREGNPTPEQVNAAVSEYFVGPAKAEIEKVRRAMEKRQQRSIFEALSPLSDPERQLVMRYLQGLRSRMVAKNEVFSLDGARYTTAVLAGLAKAIIATEATTNPPDYTLVDAGVRELFLPPKSGVEKTATEIEKALESIEKKLKKLTEDKNGGLSFSDRARHTANVVAFTGSAAMDPMALSRQLYDGAQPGLFARLIAGLQKLWQAIKFKLNI